MLCPMCVAERDASQLQLPRSLHVAMGQIPNAEIEGGLAFGCVAGDQVPVVAAKPDRINCRRIREYVRSFHTGAQVHQAQAATAIDHRCLAAVWGENDAPGFLRLRLPATCLAQGGDVPL